MSTTSISRRRAAVEAAIAAALAMALSMIVFAPIMKWVATGMVGGDILFT